MTTGMPDRLASIATRRLRFDGYVLDLDRLCLLLDGVEIALRPKTFAVLHFLAQNPTRLISKEELFAAVWPSLAITDDVLVQSIGELRRALGDNGARLIRTVPRRGYRFEPVVIAEDLPADGATGSPPRPASHDVIASSPEQASDGGPPSDPERNCPAARSIGSAIPLVLLGIVAAALSLVVAARWELRNVPAPGLHAGTARPAQEARPVLAVLPLVDQGDDPAQGYVADGLTQDIINALGRFSAMTVISGERRAAQQGEARDAGTNRWESGGSTIWLRAPWPKRDRVRVIAQLVDTRRGRVLWSARLDEALADVFALQDDIASRIAGALAIHVERVEQRRAFAKPTENLAAYDDVLRARAALQYRAGQGSLRRGFCSSTPSSSTRLTLTPMPRLAKPITSPPRWAGPKRPSHS